MKRGSEPKASQNTYLFDLYEWPARVTVDKDTLGTPFSVYILVTPENVKGDPLVGKEPVDWITSNFYCGEVAAPAGLREGPEGSASAEAVIIEGFVSLNDKLKDFIGTVKPSDVKTHLRSHLLWKVGKFGGDNKEVDLSKLPTLEVTVFSAKFKGVRDDVPLPI